MERKELYSFDQPQQREPVSDIETLLSRMPEVEAAAHRTVVEQLASEGSTELAEGYLRRSISSGGYDIQPTTGELELSENAQKASKIKRLGGFAFGSAVVGGSLVALGVELTPFNESVRIPPGIEIYRESGDEVKASAVVAALTLAIEAPASAMFSYGIHRNRDRAKKAISKIDEWLRFLDRKDNTVVDAEIGRTPEAISSEIEEAPARKTMRENVSDAGLAMSAGSLLVVAKKHYQDPERSLQDNLKTSAKGSAVLAAFSGGVAYATCWLIENGQKLGFFKEPAEKFVDYAAQWEFWAVVVGVVNGIPAIKNKIQHNRAQRAQQATAADL